jgi:hypothetical protein
MHVTDAKNYRTMENIIMDEEYLGEKILEINT